MRADSREERKLIRVSIDTGAGFLLRVSRQDLLSEKAKHVLETSSRAIFSRASADAPCHFRARGDAEPSVDTRFFVALGRTRAARGADPVSDPRALDGCTPTRSAADLRVPR